jgi:regulator of nucleoside diphosphate kinase
MSEDACILTTKDFSILEVMFDRCLGRDDPMAALLRRKLDAALVVFRDDVPGNVATLSSRVTFSVDGGAHETRVISHDRMTWPVGLFLPMTHPRGLALLGLVEGQEFRLTGHDGRRERVRLEKVNYQPEAARRESELARSPEIPPGNRPALRLVAGSLRGEPALVGPDGFDDPGPAAA